MSYLIKLMDHGKQFITFVFISISTVICFISHGAPNHSIKVIVLHVLNLSALPKLSYSFFFLAKHTWHVITGKISVNSFSL